MNKYIAEQLLKLGIEFDFDETEILIDRRASTDKVEFIQDRYYIIKLENYLINPPENFTLNTNWNKGINPQSTYMLVTYLKAVGKMKCFDGCGYDISTNTPLNDVYSELWLPEKGITIIKELR